MKLLLNFKLSMAFTNKINTKERDGHHEHIMKPRERDGHHEHIVKPRERDGHHEHIMKHNK
jgi:hypothetical protein